MITKDKVIKISLLWMSSTIILHPMPVCHYLRRYANKVSKGVATDGKGTMGWCHGFNLALMCNDRGEIITFCLTGANVDDRDKRILTVFAKELYGTPTRIYDVKITNPTEFLIICPKVNKIFWLYDFSVLKLYTLPKYII